MYVDDISSELPWEGSTSQSGRHFSKKKGSGRERGSAATSDEETELAGGTGKIPLNETKSVLAASTQIPITTNKATVADSEKRSGNLEEHKDILTTDRPASVSFTQQVKGPATTAVPVTTTASENILKPSRSDILEKSTVTSGEGSAQVGSLYAFIYYISNLSIESKSSKNYEIFRNYICNVKVKS